MERLNIADPFLVERVAAGDGDRVAIRTREETLTYREVNDLADRWAQALREAGVRREERVFVAFPDGPDFVGAFFGTLKIGAVVVMINPGLPERFGELVDLCGPTAVATESPLAGAFREASGGKIRVACRGDGGDVDPGRVSGGVAVDTVATHRDDPAIWLFSGGTTGVPKAVVQTHRSFLNTTRRYAHAVLGYGPDDITLSVPKLYFGYATGSNLLFPFSVGGSTILFPQHPTADLLFELIARHRPTILINVPTMISRMVGHPVAAEQDLSSLRFATSAGEALPPELYRAWKEAFGVELLDGLGTAEMWHVFITNRIGDVRPGTLGKVVEGFDIRICDPDGVPVPDGEVGRLWVSGESRAIGYWRDMDRTMEAFRGEWFVGGDLVRRDADGYVEHHGRADDRLKVGGKWLAPQEVESCLLEHEAVDTAVVVGVPNEEGLIKPVAYVIAASPRPGLEDELMRWTLDRLEAYKHPRRVFVVESLPTTHLGKVDRTRLKEMAAGT
jgi:benzoate-CoA ligase family protein